MSKKAKTNFFKKMAEKAKNSSIMAEAVGTAEFSKTIDTGCYILNAQLSGSLFGGFQDNKVMTLAGDPSTGKTYIAQSLLYQFLNNRSDAGAVYMDTESAVTTEMMNKRGIDVERVIRNEPITVEDYREAVLDYLEEYNPENDPPLIMILDSLSQLSTRAEIGYAEEKKDTKDMSLQRLIKAAFRVTRPRLAKAKVPLIVTNHLYMNQGGYGPAKEISGGSGLKYLSDTILMLTKAKEEDTKTGALLDKRKEYSGVLITSTTYKSRLTRENKSVQLRVSYTKGLDRYYGLLPLAQKYGIINKDGPRYKLPNGTSIFGKHINDNPVEIYNDSLLAQLEEAARKEFCYGEGEGPVPETEEATEEAAE